jgi:hypothetical protein
MNGGTRGLATLGNTSLRELLSANISQKCTFDNGEASGTLYVGVSKMRGDFTSKSGEASSTQSHMIISNNIAYVWIDGIPMGYRMGFEDLATNSGQNGGVDADAKVATKCESWQAIDTAFALPTDVTFNEVGTVPSAATQNSNTTSGNASATTGASAGADANMTYTERQCAACAMITDKTARAQCVASFDCPAN